MGSVAIIKSTLKMLCKEIPYANVRLLSMFPEIDSKQCGVISHIYPTFSPGLGLAKIKSVLSHLECAMLAILFRLSRGNNNLWVEVDKLGLLKSYMKADIVVFCATDNLSDTYNFLWFIENLKGVLFGILMKKPFVIHSSQIGPFGRDFVGKICTFLTRLLLNRVNLITVRDRFSICSLRKIGVTKPLVYLAADPAFLIQPAPYKEIKGIMSKERINVNVKPIIGINLSAMIYRHATQINPKHRLEWYLNLMSQVILYLIKKLNATVVLVPHVFDPNNDDRVIAKEILRRVSARGYGHQLKLITGEYTPEELKGIIGMFDLFISTRMHPLIHAVSTCTPAIGIDYTFKTKELMRRVDQEEATCKIDIMDYDELISKIDAAYSSIDEIREKLKIKSKEMRDCAMFSFEQILTLLEDCDAINR